MIEAESTRGSPHASLGAQLLLFQIEPNPLCDFDPLCHMLVVLEFRQSGTMSLPALGSQ